MTLGQQPFISGGESWTLNKWVPWNLFKKEEEKERNYYRMERAYGSFQRMLSLPEDADREALKAAFNKGVLTVTMPRKALKQTNVKRIEVRSTD